MKVGILTIVKDETEYLEEFIRYHLGIGFSNIIIAEDYGSLSHKEITDKFPSDKVKLLTVLDFYPTQEMKDRVVYEKTHLFNMQRGYLYNGLKWVNENTDLEWCFATDIDEFITFDPKFKDVSEALEPYNCYDALVVQWLNYGASGHIEKPNYSDEGIVGTYTEVGGFQESDEDSWFQHVKTAYNMRAYKEDNFKSNHVPNTKHVKWCRSDMSQDKERLVYDNIWIRHYITKSLEEYLWKLKIRGMFFNGHRKIEDFFGINKDMLDKREELLTWAEEYLEEKKNGGAHIYGPPF